MTLCAFMRANIPGLSWEAARKQIHGRRVRVNEVVCVDDARRLKAGDRVEIGEKPGAAINAGSVVIVYRDDDLLVIEKPAGMQTERRPEERRWSLEKRQRGGPGQPSDPQSARGRSTTLRPTT